MVLDNAQQKDLLLNIINALPMNNNYQQIKQMIVVIDELVKSISEAEVKPQ